MEPQTPIQFRLQRPAGPLPSQDDFGQSFDRDAMCAWRNLGTLSLEEAYLRFLERPWTHQEDFMFMGPVAFAYYFPVIDKYLREVEDEVAVYNGCEAWILGMAVQNQLRCQPPPQVVQAIADLSAFVQANIGRFSADTDEQERIKKSWREVDEEVAVSRCQNPIP